MRLICRRRKRPTRSSRIAGRASGTGSTRPRPTAPSALTAITLYGTLDVNASYLHEGVNKSPAADKVNYGIQRDAYESKWLAGYNGLSTSVIGLKMKEDLARVGLPGWSLIGVLEAGVNPYSGMFLNSPRSLADNNARPAGTAPFQNANFDGSRAGQWDNSQGYFGISNPVYGTLTFGRTNSLALAVTSAYDRSRRRPSRRLAFPPRSRASVPVRRPAQTPPSPIA